MFAAESFGQMRGCGVLFVLTLSVHPVLTDKFRGLSPEGRNVFEAAISKGFLECKNAQGEIIEVTSAQLNDDYCDCHDGADEPGTSACTSSFFHCQNKGFKVLNIFSSRVNDGVCDCCDGSDEWDGAKQCPNTCLADGQGYREGLRAKLARVQQGVTERQRLISEAKAMRDEKKSELDRLNGELQKIKADLEVKRGDKEAKEAIETAEREAKLAEWNKQEDERIEAEQKRLAELDAQSMKEPDELEVAVEGNAEKEAVSAGEGNPLPGAPTEPVAVAVGDVGETAPLNPEMEELSEEEGELMAVPGNFDMNAYPNGQETIQACVGWRQTGACSSNGPREEAFDLGCTDMVPKGASGFCECENGRVVGYDCDHSSFRCEDICVGGTAEAEIMEEPIMEDLGESESVEDTLKRKEMPEHSTEGEPESIPRTNRQKRYKAKKRQQESCGVGEEPGSWLSWLWAPFGHLQRWLGFGGDCVSGRRPAPAYISPEAEQARKAFKDAESDLRTVEASVATIDKELSHNYGPNDEYLPMKGKCADLNMNKYSYTVCLFEETKQNDGHSHIRLGAFSGWDEEEGNVMMFTGGQKCWNGPDRSAKIEMVCGSEFKLISADEPEKCVYHILAEIPAACHDSLISDITAELQGMES